MSSWWATGKCVNLATRSSILAMTPSDPFLIQVPEEVRISSYPEAPPLRTTVERAMPGAAVATTGKQEKRPEEGQHEHQKEHQKAIHQK